MNHLHKYKRHTSRTGTFVFRCTLTGCRHYLTKPFVIGQESLCWGCDGKLVITNKDTFRVKPKCPECRGEVTEVKSDIEDLMKRLGVS